MKIVVQVFWILFFYLLGLGLSMLIGGLVPGSVIGMVLLFVALSLGWISPDKVDAVSNILTQNMVLFFLPAAVGIMATVGLLSANVISIVVAIAVSTVLVIISVGVTQQRMEQRHNNRQEEK